MSMNRMGRGYSFEVLRARMLYDKKARKDGTAIETVLVDGDAPMTTDFVSRRMTMMTTRKKKVMRVIEL